MKTKANVKYLFHFFLVAVGSFCNANPPDWRTAMVEAGASQLEELIRRNEENARHGEYDRNSYVIDIDNWVAEYIEERGSGLPKYRMLSDEQLGQLDSKLKNFHATYSADKQTGFYVLVVNNWKVRLAKKLPVSFAINSLSDFQEFAREQEKRQLDSMVAQLNTVPQAIFARLAEKGYKKLIYVYFYAQLSTYDIDVHATQQNVDLPQTRRRVFASQQLSANQANAPPVGIFDLSTLLRNGHRTHLARVQTNIDKFVEGYAQGIAQSSRVSEARALGLVNGPGFQLFVNLPADKKLEGDARTRFVELCSYLNSKATTKTFGFYHGSIAPDALRLQNGNEIHADVLAYLYSNDLFTIGGFTEKFSEGSSRDFGVLWVDKGNDVTADIPTGYNKNSRDYLLGGVYRYSLRDLISRQEQKKLNTIFWQYIATAEISGGAEPIAMADGVEQYVALYGTYSSLFYWMKNYFIEVAEPATISGATRTLSKFRKITPIKANDVDVAKELRVYQAKKSLKKLENLYEKLPPELKAKVKNLGNQEGLAIAADEVADELIVLAAKGTDEFIEIGRVVNGRLMASVTMNTGVPVGDAIDGLQLAKNGDEFGFLAKGADVPAGLVGKLTQQGSTKLKSWLSSKTLSYADNTGAKFSGTAAETKIFNDLDAAIGNKRVLETLEDGQGRLSVVLERPGQTNQVVSIHPTSTGDFKITTFEPTYNPNLNPNIPAPVSANRLVPDYAGTPQYLHPSTQNKVITIEMKGSRNADFKAANEAGGFGSTYDIPTFTKADGTIVQYTWHHLDDFKVISGKAYCTMQLVEKTAHGGTGVTGMAHTGSVAQWKAYFGSGY